MQRSRGRQHRAAGVLPWADSDLAQVPNASAHRIGAEIPATLSKSREFACLLLTNSANPSNVRGFLKKLLAKIHSSTMRFFVSRSEVEDAEAGQAKLS